MLNKITMINFTIFVSLIQLNVVIKEQIKKIKTENLLKKNTETNESVFHNLAKIPLRRAMWQKYSI